MDPYILHQLYGMQPHLGAYGADPSAGGGFGGGGFGGQGMPQSGGYPAQYGGNQLQPGLLGGMEQHQYGGAPAGLSGLPYQSHLGHGHSPSMMLAALAPAMAPNIGMQPHDFTSAGGPTSGPQSHYPWFF